MFKSMNDMASNNNCESKNHNESKNNNESMNNIESKSNSTFKNNSESKNNCESTNNSDSTNDAAAINNCEPTGNFESKSSSEFKKSSESTNNCEFKNSSESTNNCEFKNSSESTNNCEFKNGSGSTNNCEFNNSSESKDDSASKNSSESKNKSKFKNGIESKRDFDSSKDEESKTDSRFSVDEQFKTDRKCNEQDSGKCKSNMSEPQSEQKFTSATFSLRIRNGSARKSTNLSPRFEPFGAVGGGSQNPLSLLFNRQFSGPCEETRNHRQYDNLKNKKQPINDKPSFSGVKSDCRNRQVSENKEAGRRKDNDTEGDVLHNKDSIQSNSSQQSNRNVAGSKHDLKTAAESFGSGWWGKKNKSSSKCSTQSTKSNEVVSNDQKHQVHGECKQTLCDRKGNSPTEKIPSLKVIREPSEAETLATGLWENNVPSQSVQSNSIVTPQEPQLSSETEESSRGNNKEHLKDNHTKTSESNNSAIRNSASDNRILHHSNSSAASGNTCALRGNSSSSNSHTNSATRNGTVKTNTNRAETDANSFGAGWWKKPGKKKSNSKKSTMVKVPSKTEEPKSKEEFQKESDSNDNYENTCTDVMPYEVCVNLELMVRFMKVASCITSKLIKQEATYGRVMMMSLLPVPGLWRASLGGSHISLVVQIVARIPGTRAPAVIICDKFGKKAPVIFNVTEATVYRVPGTDGLLSMPISSCLKPGTFVLLRGVNWMQSTDGSLFIFMQDMKCVDFIFYELI